MMGDDIWSYQPQRLLMKMQRQYSNYKDKNSSEEIERNTCYV